MLNARVTRSSLYMIAGLALLWVVVEEADALHYWGGSLTWERDNTNPATGAVNVTLEMYVDAQRYIPANTLSREMVEDQNIRDASGNFDYQRTTFTRSMFATLDFGDGRVIRESSAMWTVMDYGKTANPNNPQIAGNWARLRMVDPANTAQDWIDHTYSGNGPYQLQMTGGDRLNSASGHINNPGSDYALASPVDLRTANTPPTTAVPGAIQYCQTDQVCAIDLSATDPDVIDGTQILRYRFPMALEAGTSFTRPGEDQQPGEPDRDAQMGTLINPANPASTPENNLSPMLLWDTTGARTTNARTYYSVYVIAQDFTAGPDGQLGTNDDVAVGTQAPLEFVIELVDTVSTTTWSTSAMTRQFEPTPAGPSPCGREIFTTVGQAVNFRITANPDTAGWVALVDDMAIPDGATFTATNTPADPHSGNFAWTPTAGQQGTHVLQFGAQLCDPNAQPRANAQCSITVIVREAVRFNATVSSNAENVGPPDIWVSLSAEVPEPSSVEYRVLGGGTANPGPAGTLDPDDFDLADGTLNFAANETALRIPGFTVHDDSVDENDETVIIELFNPSAQLFIQQGRGEHTHTILDDDSVHFDVTTLGAIERDVASDNVVMRFTITRSGETAHSDHSLQVRTVDGTAYATASGSMPGRPDYVGRDEPAITYDQNDSRVYFDVEIVEDVVDELDETFNVEIYGVDHGASYGPPGTGTIIDDDEARLRIDDVPAVLEGDTTSDQATIHFAVVLSSPVDRTVELDVFTQAPGSGAATPGTDFVDIPQTSPQRVSFFPGHQHEPVPIDILEDLVDEPDFESLELRGMNPTQGIRFEANGDRGQSAIEDDDDVTFSLTAMGTIEGDTAADASILMFRVDRDVDSTRPMSVRFDTLTVGSADAGVDYIARTNHQVNFGQGELFKIVEVEVIEDTLDENDQTVVGRIRDPSPAGSIDSGRREATATITDDDTIGFSLLDAANVVEGDTAADDRALIFTLEPHGEADRTIEVDIEFTSGTATEGTDFPDQGTPGTITIPFPAGSGPQDIRLEIIEDLIDESDETVLGSIVAVRQGNIVDGDAVGLIVDDDTAEIHIEDVTVMERDPGDTPLDASFRVYLSTLADRMITVQAATVPGDASPADNDYQDPGTTTITFAPLDDEEFFDVPIQFDQTMEAAETFTVELQNPQGAPLATSGSDVQPATGTIEDDDDVGIRILDTQIVEGDPGDNQQLTFTVELVGASDVAVSVDWDSQDGSSSTPASAATDYFGAMGTLTIPRGQTSDTIQIDIREDERQEADEHMEVVLSSPSPSGAYLDDDTGVGLILNDDTVQLVILGDTVTEGGPGAAGTLRPVIERIGDTDFDITVDFATASGTATGGVDYQVVNTQEVIPWSQSSITVSVPVTADVICEDDETASANIANPSHNAMLQTPQATLEILDDDTCRWSISDAQVVEGDSAADDRKLRFTVSLDPASTRTESVDYVTAGITATESATGAAPDDYLGTQSGGTGTATLGPGLPSTIVEIPILEDVRVEEAMETMRVTLQNPSSNTVIDDGEGIGTIDDDDEARLSVSDAQVVEGDAAGDDRRLQFTISIDAAADVAVTVDWQTFDDTTALNGIQDVEHSSGTALIPRGDTSTAVEINIVEDTIDEEDQERMELRLTNPSARATLMDDVGVGIIEDDDVQDFRIDYSGRPMHEGDDPAEDRTGYVVVRRALLTERPTDVHLETDDLTAIAGEDYDAKTWTINIAPSPPLPMNGVETFVSYIEDTTCEGDEELLVRITGASVPATFSARETELPIENDDTCTWDVGDASVVEGDTGTTTLSFPVTLDHPAADSMSVAYRTQATAGSDRADPDPPTDVENHLDDYSSVDGTFTMPPGGLSGNIAVPVHADLVVEGDEKLQLIIEQPSQQSTPRTMAAPMQIGDDTGDGTIDDDDVSTWSVDDVTVTEGDASCPNGAQATFIISRDRDAARNAAVRYETRAISGEALPADDYRTTSGTATFAPGQMTFPVDVPICGDDIAELTEVFDFCLRLPDPGTMIGRECGRGTIEDDDEVVLRIEDTSVVEGDVPTDDRRLTFTVTKQTDSDLTVSVDFVALPAPGIEPAQPGTAFPADYEDPGTITLTFARGEFSKTAQVHILEDDQDEPDRFVLGRLQNPDFARIERAEAQGAIIDDDATVVGIAEASGPADETGPVDGMFRVFRNPWSLDAPLAIDLSWPVFVNSADDADFRVLRPGTVTIPAGEDEAFFDVLVRDDTEDEVTETIRAVVEPSIRYRVGSQASAELDLLDNDDPILEIIASQPQAAEPGTDGAFEVRRIGPATRAVNFGLSIGGDASPGAAGTPDYDRIQGSHVMQIGQTSLTIPVVVNDDSIDEPLERVTATLNRGSGYLVGAADNATVTILDDDLPLVTLEAVDDTANEDDATDQGRILVRRETENRQAELTVSLRRDGSATFGSDYTLSPTLPNPQGTLTFLAGQMELAIVVTAADDNEDEPPCETVTYTVDPMPDYRLGTPSAGTVCISEDTDGDGIPDIDDNCVERANPNQRDQDGDGEGDACDEDVDGDGIPNLSDGCPGAFDSDQTDSDGDGIGDACDDRSPPLDSDADGVPDNQDNCPAHPNRSQVDTDGDGQGDVCDVESFVNNPGQEDPANQGNNQGNGEAPSGTGDGDFDPEVPSTDDRDLDGIADLMDNCPEIPNQDQADLDGDGIGDVCDADIDGDQVPQLRPNGSFHDNCPYVFNTDQSDANGDGRGDACEDDYDNDGVQDAEDNCWTIPNADQVDADDDGIGDACAHLDAGPPPVSAVPEGLGAQDDPGGSANDADDGEQTQTDTESSGGLPTIPLVGGLILVALLFVGIIVALFVRRRRA